MITHQSSLSMYTENATGKYENNVFNKKLFHCGGDNRLWFLF
jgi:hypothetical protein